MMGPMRYVMLPHVWEETVAELESHGHERVEDLTQADFVLYTTYSGSFPELPENIKFVQTAFAGLDGLLKNGQLDPSVRWANAAGWYADSVAESTLGLMLAVYHQHKRATLAASFDVADELQDSTNFLFLDKTVVILGAGGIGERLIELLEPFHATTIAVNHSGREVRGATETHSLDEIRHGDSVWGRADFLVNLLPHTEATEKLVDAQLLASLKPGCVVVNTGRGGTMDTPALTDALESGRLGGAGLDVTDPEPLPEGHPLWSMPNVVITPHTANTVPNMRRVTGRHTAQNAQLFAEGKKMATEVELDAQY